VSLFGEAGADLPEPRLSPVSDWMPAERLNEEFRAVGFYMSGHPLDDYMAPLKRKGVMTLDEVTAKAENGALVAKLAGVVAGRQERKSARGNRFAFAQLSDTSGAYEVTLFSDTLDKWLSRSRRIWKAISSSCWVAPLRRLMWWLQMRARRVCEFSSKIQALFPTLRLCFRARKKL